MGACTTPTTHAPLESPLPTTVPMCRIIKIQPVKAMVAVSDACMLSSKFYGARARMCFHRMGSTELLIAPCCHSFLLALFTFDPRQLRVRSQCTLQGRENANFKQKLCFSWSESTISTQNPQCLRMTSNPLSSSGFKLLYNRKEGNEKLAPALNMFKMLQDLRTLREFRVHLPSSAPPHLTHCFNCSKITFASEQVSPPPFSGLRVLISPFSTTAENREQRGPPRTCAMSSHSKPRALQALAVGSERMRTLPTAPTDSPQAAETKGSLTVMHTMKSAPAALSLSKSCT